VVAAYRQLPLSKAEFSIIDGNLGPNLK
jgi:hypothetical protein